MDFSEPVWPHQLYNTSHSEERLSRPSTNAICIKSLSDFFYPKGLSQPVSEDVEEDIELSSFELLTEADKELAKTLAEMLTSENVSGLSEKFYELVSLPTVLSLIVEDAPTLNDEPFETLCDLVSKKDMSHSESVAFFSTIFLYRVKQLDQPPSRVLINSLLACGKKYPKALKESILLPLVISGIELITSLVFDCLSSEYQASFLLELVSSPTFAWNEQTVVTVQNILNKQTFVLTQPVMDGLVKQFEGSVKSFAKNLKFCTLLFQLVSKYPALVTPHTFTLQQVLNQTDTFMTKKALAKLNSIT